MTYGNTALLVSVHTALQILAESHAVILWKYDVNFTAWFLDNVVMHFRVVFCLTVINYEPTAYKYETKAYNNKPTAYNYEPTAYN